MMKPSIFLLLLTAVSSRRNVLFFLEDDGGFAIGAYGDKVIGTPNLDALAERGVVFDAAYTSVSSCSPSRASILTGVPTHTSGQYGLAHGQEHFSSFSGIQSMPNLVNAAGMASGIIGKYHVWDSGDLNLGFSSYNFSWGNLATGPGGCQSGASNSCPDTDYNLVSRNITYMAAEMKSFLTWASPSSPSSSPPGDDAAVGAGNTSWLLYVGFGDSHRCGGSVGEFCEFYGIDANGKSTIPDWTPQRYDPSSVQLPWWIQDTPVARSDYAGMMTAKNRLDQGVGLLTRVLEESGQANDTMIIYFSDNGAPFAAGKTNFFEPGAGEPLIISVPGGAAGVRTSVLASALDLLPTVMDWMQVPFVPYSLNGKAVQLLGKSLLPLILPPTTSSSNSAWEAVSQDLQAEAAAAVQEASVHIMAMTTEQRHSKEARGKMTHLRRTRDTAPTPLPSNYSKVYGSFQAHEIQEYFPMRLIIASDPLPALRGATAVPPTFKYKLIYNIAGALPYPIASDLWTAPAMQDLINRTAAGQPTNWYRNFTEYLGPRNKWQLYDLLADPSEMNDQSASPAYAAILATLQADIKAWQIGTNDDWVIKYSHE